MSEDYTLLRLIHSSMQLDWEPSATGGKWQWPKENGQASKGNKGKEEKIKLELVEEQDGFSRSVAFSLDMVSDKIRDRFPFLRRDDHRIKKIARICDIIVLMHKDNALRAFVIEVKDTYPKKASSQIKNSAFFCEWLHLLLNEHCGFPDRLETVRILCLTRRETKRPESKPNDDVKPNPTPTHNQTLRYNSVRTIRLIDAYKYCNIFKFLEVKTLTSKKMNEQPELPL